MARIRTIKPEFWADEKVAQLPLGARLLFIGLWTCADDEGRLRGNPLLLRAQVFPYDPKADVEGWLEELVRLQLVQRYVVDGQSYLWVRHFLDHQQISHPSKSRFPSPPEDSGGTLEDSRSPPEDSGGIRDQGTGKGTGNREQGREQGETPAAGPPEDPDPVEAAFACWNRHRDPGFPEAKRLTDDRKKLIRQALKLVPLADWPAAIARVNGWPWSHGVGQKPPGDWRPSLDWLLATDGHRTPNILRAAEGQLGAAPPPPDGRRPGPTVSEEEFKRITGEPP